MNKRIRVEASLRAYSSAFAKDQDRMTISGLKGEIRKLHKLVLQLDECDASDQGRLYFTDPDRPALF